MMRATTVVLLLLATALAGCAADPPGSGTTTTTPPADGQQGAPTEPTPEEESTEPTPEEEPAPEPAPSSAAVDIAGFAFSPRDVTVAVGATVTWTNQDSAPHTATADDGAFDTGVLAQGQSGSVTFDTAGTYPYHCAVHPSMTGTVTVQA